MNDQIHQELTHVVYSSIKDTVLLQHLQSSVQWLRPWSGSFAKEESREGCTTWMTSCSWSHQIYQNTHVLATTIVTCEGLRVSLAKEKIEGPVYEAHLSGYLLCSNLLQASLLQMKLKLDAPQFKLQQIIGARCIQKQLPWSP